MPGHASPDPRVERIYADLEADIERAARRAVTRLSRLPRSVRSQIDPYGLLLGPDAPAPRRRG